MLKTRNFNALHGFNKSVSLSSFRIEFAGVLRKVCMYAAKAVAAHEELLFDYGPLFKVASAGC